MFVTYLRRELLRRRKAAFVVAMGLAVGIALVITVSSVSAGMQQAQGKVLESLYGLGTDMTVASPVQPAADGAGQRRHGFDFNANGGGTQQNADRVLVEGGQTMDATTVDAVGSQPGVAAAVGGLSLQVVKVSGQFNAGRIAQDPGGEGAEAPHDPGSRIEGGGAQFNVNNFTVNGVDTARLDVGPMTALTISSGTAFAPDQPDAKSAVLDSAYAGQAGLKLGDNVTISGSDFNVIGIVTATAGGPTANVYVPLIQAQTLAAAPGKVSTVYVKATDSTQIGSVKSAIEKNVPGTTVTTAADLAQTVSGSLSTASGLASRVGRWLSFAVLAAAFLVAALLTSAAVNRRVREFGTLKALGWSSRRVTGQVMGEALVNGLIGGALGIALGLGAAYAVTGFSPTLAAQLGAGAAGPARGFGGAGRRAVGRTLQVAVSAPVSAGIIVLAVALALAGGLVAGTYGGLRASRLRPADALRRVE